MYLTRKDIPSQKALPEAASQMGVSARVRQTLGNKHTEPQKSAKFVLYEMCKQFAESKSIVSVYKASELSSQKKEKLFLVQGIFKKSKINQVILLILQSFTSYQYHIITPRRRVGRLLKGGSIWICREAPTDVWVKFA